MSSRYSSRFRSSVVELFEEGTFTMTQRAKPTWPSQGGRDRDHLPQPLVWGGASAPASCHPCLPPSGPPEPVLPALPRGQPSELGVAR